MSWRMGWLWLLATLSLSLSLSMQVQAQTTVEYIHSDALGSVVAVTNAAGQVIERNDYEPYGAVIGQPNFGGVGFTGHVQDAATGLTYMQQRYYDPGIGRFLSVDPVTADGNTGGNFNRYKYAANNPYRFIDPDGRAERDNRSIAFKSPGFANSEAGTMIDRAPAESRSGGGADGKKSSSDDDSIVDLKGVEVTVDAADVGLSAHALFLPNKVGDWAQGSMGISKWEGLSPADLRRVRSVAKVGSAVSYLTIGVSAYDFQQAVRERNGYEMANSGADLGFGLYGLTGPVGAAAAAGYGGMSLLLEIPAVYDHTVTPLVDAACRATSNC